MDYFRYVYFFIVNLYIFLYYLRIYLSWADEI